MNTKKNTSDIFVKLIHAEDLSDNTDNIAPITIEETEFAFDIWLFKLDNSGPPILTGLYRDGIINRLASKGYYKRYRDDNNTYFFIREISNIICEEEPCKMKDEIFGYVKRIDKPVQFNYRGYQISIKPEKLKETFLKQSHLIFNKTFLEHLPIHKKQLFKDDQNFSYFYFSNCIVKVTSEGINVLTYDDINDRCIWHSHIKDFVFEYDENNQCCHFSNFIINVSLNEEERHLAFKTAIGYLLHNFSSPSERQAIIAYDEVITDIKNPMGGTGKGIFANAIKQMREVTKIDGKKFSSQERFRFQGINYSTQIVWLDDIKPDMEFNVLHSCLTDGWIIEKKNKDQFYIKPENSPKVLICSNTVIKGGGVTNKRRQFVLEFSNHYSSKIKNGIEEPVKTEHGCIFFDNDYWDAQEWNKFYSFMFDCVKLYFKNGGLYYYTPHCVLKNKILQSTNREFYDWVQKQYFQINIKYFTKNLFENFRDTYYGKDSDLNQRTFNNWLKEYAKVNEWSMENKYSHEIASFIFRETG